MEKRQRALHPFLFAIYPVLEMFFKISPAVAFTDILRALLVVPLLVGVCMVLLYQFERDWERAGFVTTILLFILFFYGSFHHVAWNWTVGGIRLGRHEILFPLWTLILLGLSSRWAWERLRVSHFITLFLNVMVTVAIMFSLGRYIVKLCALSNTTDVTVSRVVELVHQESMTLHAEPPAPDIYYIVLDSYGRDDVLQQIYGLDNGEFLTFLQERGFYVAEESHSNYMQTSFSLASSLNLDYLDVGISDSQSREPLNILIQQSRVRTLLVEQGYQIVAVASGFGVTEIQDADVYLSANPDPVLNQFEGLLLIGSSLVIPIDKGIINMPVVGHGSNRVQVRYALKQLPEVVTLPGPKFVFFHIISPHPPFVLDRNGNFRESFSPYVGGFDGDALAGPPESYIPGYTEKLLYTNQMLKIAIETILANSTTPPIIILQADHGPGLFWSRNSVEDTCIWERFAILNAYYLPGDGASQLYPTITPVNSFRVVFDTYFGTHLGLLEDRNYYSGWSTPYNFTDVTGRVLLPCAVP